MHCPAGVYIPMLAQQIDTKGGINLKVRGSGHSLTHFDDCKTRYYQMFRG
jgi:hypothetical protein